MVEQEEAIKKTIDNMSRLEMAKIWRFAASNSRYLQGNIGAYFSNRFFNELGGFTPEISKQIGW